MAQDQGDGVTLTGSDGKTVFVSIETLRNVTPRTFTAYDPWEKVRHDYTGVPLTALFDANGLAPAEWIDVVATNDYRVSIAWQDAVRMGHVLAYIMDGRALSDHPKGRNKAPAMIAIPFGADSEIDVYKHQLVWMVESIHLRNGSPQ